MDSTAVTVSTIQPLLEALSTQISVANVVTVLVAGVGASCGFAFMWWGGRKLVRMLMSGFKKGKVSL